MGFARYKNRSAYCAVIAEVEVGQALRVKRVVAASTASVYGMAERFPTPEDHHPYGNRTWYGASKVMLEGLLRACQAAMKRAKKNGKDAIITAEAGDFSG